MARRRNIKHTDNLKGRPKPVRIMLTIGEEDELYEAAERKDASLQFWARTRLLAAAQVEKQEDDNVEDENSD